MRDRNTDTNNLGTFSNIHHDTKYTFDYGTKIHLT